MDDHVEGGSGVAPAPDPPGREDPLGTAALYGLARVRRRVAAIPGRVLAAPGVARGVALSVQLGVIVLGMAIGAHLHTGGGLLFDMAVGALLGALLLGLAEGAVDLAVQVVRAGLVVLGSLGVAGLVVFVVLLWPFGRLPPTGALALALVGSTGLALVGAGLGARAAASRSGWTGRSTAALPAEEDLPAGLRSRTGWAMATAGFLVVASLLLLVVHPGSAGHLVPPPEVSDGFPSLALPDPGTPGPHEVDAWTYGAGTDRWRPEYGEDGVRYATGTVDGTGLLEAWGGWRGRLRSTWWGFGPEALPLNARVWSPDGEGPHPLVLIVHGNHPMSRFSDPGYAYLARHLASWGYVAASVDQNFLNAGWFGGLAPENDARAWLLLEHLALWRRWTEGREHEVARRVDLDRVVLIGHSGGGEAAAVAATFNRLVHYPEDASLTFDYGFGIRGVAAIAPSDGQYRPAGRKTPLRDVSYLVVQGGHDADVSSFAGERQFGRAELTAGSGAFKAAFYIHEANHGQFNTVWGDRDRFPPWAWLLNRAPLMGGEEQRRAARVVLTAFVEAAVRDRTGYRALFEDPRLAREWLPRANYLSQLREPGFVVVADFEEDVDLLTGSYPRSLISAEGLSLWREQDAGFRGAGTRDRQVVALGWRRPPSSGQRAEGTNTSARDGSDAPPEYRIHLPATFGPDMGLDSSASLVFSIAALPQAPAGWEEGRTLRSPSAPLHFSVELHDEWGRRASLSLDEIRPVHPPLEARYAKIPFLERAFGAPTEPVFQDVWIPLRNFLEVVPGFEPWALRTITFRFDGTREGVVLLDAVGFAPQAGAPALASSSSSVNPGPRWDSSSSR